MPGLYYQTTLDQLRDIATTPEYDMGHKHSCGHRDFCNDEKDVICLTCHLEWMRNNK